MSINSINGPGYNPYARAIGGTSATQRPATIATTVATPRDPAGTQSPTTSPNGAQGVASGVASPKSLAQAIKSDASSRAAQVSSSQAPDGVDQELWSVLTKEERGFFVKAGAMGPLTYGRFTPTQSAPAAPIVRGGRLDIKA